MAWPALPSWGFTGRLTPSLSRGPTPCKITRSALVGKNGSNCGKTGTVPANSLPFTRNSWTFAAVVETFQEVVQKPYGGAGGAVGHGGHVVRMGDLCIHGLDHGYAVPVFCPIRCTR